MDLQSRFCLICVPLVFGSYDDSSCSYSFMSHVTTHLHAPFTSLRPRAMLRPSFYLSVYLSFQYWQTQCTENTYPNFSSPPLYHSTFRPATSVVCREIVYNKI